MKKLILLACLFSLGLLSCDKDNDEEKKYCSKQKNINPMKRTTYTCGHCGNSVSESAKMCPTCNYWFR